jgi:hypothetical protein
MGNLTIRAPHGRNDGTGSVEWEGGEGHAKELETEAQALLCL